MKKWIALLLAAAMIAALLLSVPLTASADSLYIRKVVSVVYDDSTSMLNGNKWAYANYAMQAFCGMLNSEDQLYITYMYRALYYSNYQPEKIDLSAGGIQKSLDAIRSHPTGYSTPFEAVQMAFDKLSQVPDDNPNTEYWLVVITDGDFNACQQMSKESDKQKYVDEHFGAFYGAQMPNGSTVKITFLSIGDNIRIPSGDESDGLYKYHASSADGIIGAMNDMADQISGRTRLSSGDISQVDDKTIQVTSAIPLLNIAVLLQESRAKMTGASHSDGKTIPIGRSATLSYSNNQALQGSAYLIGDSQTVIEAGTYQITFDQAVNLDEIVVLFEPALEMRMTMTVNGKPITDYSQLDDTAEGDVINVSCGIYEMGTDKQVDTSLLPPGTSYEITVKENGQVVKTADGSGMTLSGYTLKHLETEITAKALIDGFNPIEYSVKFTPGEYVPPVVYTIEADYSDGRSIKFDDIAGNRDMHLIFTILADGVAITDPEAVKALNPVITVSPAGNNGAMSYSDDGKIIFTPNAAGTPAAGADHFQVDVTCTLDNGTSATLDYTVLMADYQVVPVGTTETITKTQFCGNSVGVSFYITKDGVKLDKNAIGSHMSVLFNEAYADLLKQVTVDPDGTIHVLPYSEEEHILTFWTWWTNWAYYFGLEDSDLIITLDHAFGSASTTIDVVPESPSYEFWNVWVPLILEVLLVAAIVAYIIRYITRPRFAPNAVLYVGSITRSISRGGTHLLELREVPLKPFNKFKYLWNPFKELTVSANGVMITAVKGNRIRCEEPFPWYSESVRPRQKNLQINSPKDVVNYCMDHDEIEILEIKPITVMDSQNAVVSQDDSVYYFVRASVGYTRNGAHQLEVIEDALVFCYSTQQN
jgi:hypothetical protein